MGTPDIFVLFGVVHCTMYNRGRPGRPFLGDVSGFCIFHLLKYFGERNVPDDFFLLFCPNLTPPFQRLVVAGGFGDASALASTEVITVPLEFY